MEPTIPIEEKKSPWWAHVGTWVGLLATGLPLFGFAFIVVYAFATSGSHTSYLAVGMLTAIAALVAGVLAGFLFGIRPVSSGDVRRRVVGQGTGDGNVPAASPKDYTFSPNLAEVSDWLTKLLLGAGLVELTKMGRPIGNFIDRVASGMATTATGDAKAVAGAVMFGYVILGFMQGYVLTTVWYQKKLNDQGT